jgi:arginine N-succinyltransferase
MAGYEIRAALPGDEEQLLDVARHLDSVNLPDDRDSIHEIVDHSYKSFTGEIQNPRLRTYVFVVRDLDKQRIIGTSMIIAQLGRRGAPYIYFDVLDEEKYSATIDKHFHHTVLRIGYSYNGPTEIGGLVLVPEYRKANEKLGLMISYVRFLYLAIHKELFQNEVLAELLPPLEPDGTSHLWEALGRRFTAMSYAEADFLSKKNKEFIKSLFPEGVIYASVLSEGAQKVIGKTGVQTRGVEKLLRRIGFRYAHRVDPFDGGPHYTAPMNEIALIDKTRRTKATKPFVAAAGDTRALVAVEHEGPPFFRAVLARVRDADKNYGGRVPGAAGQEADNPARRSPSGARENTNGTAVSQDAWETLGLDEASSIVVLPME